MKRSGMIFILAGMLAASRAVGAEPEALCTSIDGEIGGHCRCAESLDTSDASDNYTSGQETYYNPGGSDNPKSCEGLPWLHDPPEYPWMTPVGKATPVPVAETGMPVGNSVSYVWSTDSCNVGPGESCVTILAGQSSLLPTSKRICYRHYFKFSDPYQEWQGPSGCNGNKIADMGFNDGSVSNRGALQMTDGSGSGNLTVWCSEWSEAPCTGGPTGGPSHLEGGPSQVSVYDCMGEWCRAEICVGSDSVLTDGQDNYVSWYYEVVSGPNTGRREGLVDYFLGNMVPPASRMGRYMIVDMYREGQAGGCPGTREVSHAMHAEWDTDDGQWIGAATGVEGPGVAACSDSIDNDGDGLADFPADPGCDDAADLSETSAALTCDDGADNDGDGLTDYPDDAGCRDPEWSFENPACSDGVDNDGDGLVDFDGGESIHGACSGGVCPPGVSDPDLDGIADPDPYCVGMPHRNRERQGCGLGFELALLLAGLRVGSCRSRRGGGGLTAKR